MFFFFADKKKAQRKHLSKAFDHDCTIKDTIDRIPPKVVSPQNLRNLRHYYMTKEYVRFVHIVIIHGNMKNLCSPI